MRAWTLPIRPHQVAAPLLAGLLAAASAMGLLVATDALEGRWLWALLIGLFVLWVAVVTRDAERFFLFAFVFFLPINADVNFGWKGDELTAAGAKGLSLSACDVAMVALLVMWMMRLLTCRPQDRRLRFVPSISLPFGLFMLWSGLSIMRSLDPVLSVYELVQLGKVWFFFLYLANNVHNDRQLRWVGLALCAGILLQGLVVCAQYFLGTTFNLAVFGETRRSLVLQAVGGGQLTRVGGTLGHPNRLAFFLVSVLPIAIALGLSGTFRWLTLVARFSFAVALAALVMTFSRGAWFTAATVLPVVVLLGAWRRWGFARAWQAVVGFGLLVCVVVLPLAGPIGTRLFEHDYGRGMSRLAHVQVASKMIRSNPVLGVGLNNYTLAMKNYDNTLEKITVHLRTPVHNLYMLTAAEVGIPGLLFLLWLMVGLLRRGWRGFVQTRGLSSLFCLGLLGGLTGFLLHSMVEPRFARTDYFLSFFMGMLGASALWIRPRETSQGPR